MRRVKKVLLFMVVFLISLNFIGGNIETEAKTYTRAEVRKKIKSLKEEKKKVENKYKKAKSDYEAKKKKIIQLNLPNEILSTNPFIVKVSGFFLGGPSYYWILNPDDLDSTLIFVVGNVQPTGRYLNYNGFTCVECMAVKNFHEPKDLEEKLNKVKRKITSYEFMLKDFIKLEDLTLKEGEKKSLEWEWDVTGEGNRLTFKSSNPKIAKVDQKGKVTGIKSGKVTITATASLSGKTSKCKVVVKEKPKTIAFEQENYIFFKDQIKNNWKKGLSKKEKKQKQNYYNFFYTLIGDTFGEFIAPDKEEGRLYDDLGKRIVKIKYKYSDGELKEKIKIDSSFKGLLEYNPKITGKDPNGEISLIINNVGRTIITLTTESGLKAQCEVSVVKEKNKKIEPLYRSGTLNLAYINKDVYYAIPLKMNGKVMNRIDYLLSSYHLYLESSNPKIAELSKNEMYVKFKKTGKVTLILKSALDEKLKVKFDINIYNKPGEFDVPKEEDELESKDTGEEQDEEVEE